jgi:hypothetical protein
MGEKGGEFVFLAAIKQQKKNPKVDLLKQFMRIILPCVSGFSIFLCLPFSYRDTVIVFRATLIQDDLTSRP